MATPPKPWEVTPAVTGATTVGAADPLSSLTGSTWTSQTGYNRFGSPYGSTYGAGGYGGYGSSFGGYGSSFGYGSGYGSGYSGYGSGLGGYGGGFGYGGMGGPPTGGFFAPLHAVTGTLVGFAEMLNGVLNAVGFAGSTFSTIYRTINAWLMDAQGAQPHGHPHGMVPPGHPAAPYAAGSSASGAVPGHWGSSSGSIVNGAPQSTPHPLQLPDGTFGVPNSVPSRGTDVVSASSATSGAEGSASQQTAAGVPRPQMSLWDFLKSRIHGITARDVILAVVFLLLATFLARRGVRHVFGRGARRAARLPANAIGGGGGNGPLRGGSGGTGSIFGGGLEASSSSAFGVATNAVQRQPAAVVRAHAAPSHAGGAVTAPTDLATAWGS